VSAGARVRRLAERQGVPLDATRLDWWWERWTTELVDAHKRAPLPAWWLWTHSFGEAVRFAPNGAYRCLYCEGHHRKPDTPGVFQQNPWGSPKGLGETYCHRARFVIEVVNRFPSLRNSPHLMPWSAEKFARYWRTSGAITGGSGHAVAFVLNVWNSEWAVSHRWPFNIVRAMGTWDHAHRRAFMEWCERPYLP
jgi:hypothetical protein